MRGRWMEQRKKRFRNAGILAVALCVVIGIASMKQDREKRGVEELAVQSGYKFVEVESGDEMP